MIFHLAISVSDLTTAVKFYTSVLDCKVGRSAECWCDLDFYGHQLSLHEMQGENHVKVSTVDGKNVPLPHFGVVVPMDKWSSTIQKLNEYNVSYIYPPSVRYANGHAQQNTVFFKDPFDNHIELKSFNNENEIFQNP